MDYILMEKKDLKSIKISEELKSDNFKVVFLPNNPIFNLFKIINSLLKYGKPKAIVYRYLNDFDSLPKNLINIIFEHMEYFLMKVLKVKVFWICHNVDRETHIYSRRLNSYRRSLILKYVNKIFVTDVELKEIALEYLQVEKSRISYITFGKMTNELITSKDQDFIYNEIEEFVKKEKSLTEENIYFTFCAGKANHKTQHYKLIKKLIQEGANNNIRIRAIVVGPLEEYYSNSDKDTLQFLQNDSRVLFINGFYRFDESKFEHLIDFYWRVYSDYSIPGTIYKAVELGKPIVTMEFGILPKVVKKNGVGFIVNENFNNLWNIFTSLNSIPKKNYRDFQATHNWRVAAKNIVKAIKY